MSLTLLYFGMRSPSSWSWESFVKYYPYSDAKYRWISALKAIRDSKESDSDEANRIKAKELVEQSEDPNSPNCVRIQKKRAASVHSLERRESDRLVVDDWRTCAKEPWYFAPFRLFNSMLPESMKYFSKKAVANFKSWSINHILESKMKPETMDAIVQSAESCHHLSTLVKSANPSLKNADFKGFSVADQDYIWMNIAWQSWLWRAHSAENRLVEGWLIAFVYTPLMSSLIEIPGTTLRMTEYKVSAESLGHQMLVTTETLQDWINGSIDYRHDALLRVTELNIDVMVMEAKPGVDGSEHDIEKLGVILANILRGIKTRYPSVGKKLKVHGVMFTGYRVQFLEARFPKGPKGSKVLKGLKGSKVLKGSEGQDAVIYSVSDVTVPYEQDVAKLVEALKMFIEFKKRVEETVENLREAANLSR
ncbi:hypothetical protein BGX34_005165 [Mortierella sp. NVP85]|nr:hypothetical protein BGX34_005165 [Mortierella sp. NVP85]